MKKGMMVLFALARVLSAWAQTSIYEGFANPPQEARPQVWVQEECTVPEQKSAEATKTLIWRTLEVEGPGVQILRMPFEKDTISWIEHVATMAVKLPSPITVVQDLSLVDQNGFLIWDVPDGHWRIYRFGAARTEADDAATLTWTKTIFQEFQEKRFYNLFPWLPALTGETLRSPSQTERFLFDWRRTLGELFGENFLHPVDINRKPGLVDIRESASKAHLSGQDIVTTETSADSSNLEDLKNTVDTEMKNGVNRFSLDKASDNPWTEVWGDYLARSSYLLQQGRHKADILYCYGEDCRVTDLDRLPEIPDGYDFDFISPERLQNGVIPIDNCLETASGMKYKMLVLGPNCRKMSFDLLHRIVYLAEAGVPVCGTLPEESASLSNLQASFDLLLLQLKPLFLEMPLHEALQEKDIEPDCIPHKDWAFVHRETDQEDIWWIRNFSGAPDATIVRVHAGAGQPRILDPATGDVRPIRAFMSSDGYRSLMLEMEENDALFVVIGKNEEDEIPVTVTQRTPLLTVDTPWTPAGDGWQNAFTLKKKQLKGVVSFEIYLGGVKGPARVSLNGHDLGVAWKAPYRLDVPAGYLQAGVNSLEVKTIPSDRPGTVTVSAVKVLP